MTHRLKLAAAAALFATFAAAPAGAVASAADCEYEGGEVFDVAGAKVCMVPIRAEEFHGEEYDGQQLGVKSCDGEEVMDGGWCKITLVPAPAKPETPMTDDMMDADMEMMDDDASN